MMASHTLVTLDDFEIAAYDTMDECSKLYFSAGAGSRTTPPFNEEAFQKYFIRPRMLQDITAAQLNCDILGSSASCPIGVSPTAMHSLVHPDGEMATAAGSSCEGCTYVMSSSASKTVEEVTRHAPNGQRWMQMYACQDRHHNLQLMRRAEANGFSALVVTVDVPVTGLWRDFMSHSNIEQRDAFRRANLPAKPRLTLNRTVTFDEFRWFKENTTLPIIAKGILCGQDAIEAVGAGASAIYVSNHGGRLIRRVIPTIHVLEEVVAAVKDTGVDVYLDGGVRSGSDVFVALALGVKAVFVGRPVVWGLCVNGEEGVKRVLNILKMELLRTMQLSGVAKIEDIRRDMVEKIY